MKTKRVLIALIAVLSSVVGLSPCWSVAQQAIQTRSVEELIADLCKGSLEAKFDPARGICVEMEIPKGDNKTSYIEDLRAWEGRMQEQGGIRQ